MAVPSSPCAACKFLRRKCTQECVFAPFFPPDQPQKFANVHKVFGASNVSKLLNELPTSQREDAVNSLAYEADARLRYPVYGCVGLISVLQHRLKEIQTETYNAKKDLSQYIGPQAMLPIMAQQQHLGNPPGSGLIQQNIGLPIMASNGIPTGSVHASRGPMMISETQQQQQQQNYEAQHLAAALAAREQQEMFRAYEQQQLLALGSFDTTNYQIQQEDIDNQQQEHQIQEAQLFLQPTN